MKWHRLLTETRHPETSKLDTFSSEQVVAAVLEEDRRGLESALRHRQVIARAADQVAETLQAGGDVVFAGAGTSGRLGVLEASECPPTFGTDPSRIRALIAGGEDAVFRAKEGAEDQGDNGRDKARQLDKGDLLIGLSASSVTPFVRGALEAARQQGTRTILLTCAAPAGLDDCADLVIALETGPEVLTGSTRLKAGSATKAALNAITNAAMVRLGKVYENLMVDLRVGSAKLKDRAVRIIDAATDVGPGEAARLYEEAGGEVKTAIVMASAGLGVSEARQRLRDAEGHVRRALG